MKCKNCGEELDEMIKFCPSCGEKVERERYCKECGTELEQSSKFCYLCGTPVEEENLQKKEKTNTDKSDITQKKIISVQDKKTELLKEEDSMEGLSLEQQATLRAMYDSHIIEEPEEEKAQRELKPLRYKVGFKWALLIAFIAFFMPFCTVSCGQQVLLSSNGYELTGSWGMTSEQMEMLEVVPEDTGNFLIVIILLLMVAAVIVVNGKVIHTVQTGLAALLLFIFAHAEEWDGIRSIGCQVKFGYGYYLALIFLILAATAFLWAPVLVQRLEEFFVVNRNNMAGDIKAYRILHKANIGLFCLLIMVIATAAYINKDSLSAWKAVLYNRDKIPDLKNNLSPDLESEWWDDEWWDELFEDEG